MTEVIKMARESNETGTSGTQAERPKAFSVARDQPWWHFWGRGERPSVVRLGERPSVRLRERPNVVRLSPDVKSEYPSSPAMNEYRITARHVRGLQIGERNLQVNTYEYEVERPDIDFTAVLSRADVREALKALSTEPDNAALQRKADGLLAQGPLFRKKPELRVEQSTMSSERQSSLFEAFIFIRKCQGVQIGNDATQKNRFVYVVAPTVHARQLLTDDPSVRAALMRCVCSTDVARSEERFRDELSGALEDAILTSPEIRTTGIEIRPRAHGRVDINGGDGVQVDIGGKGRQENTASAMVVIPGSVVRPLCEERESLEKRRQRDEKVRSRTEERDRDPTGKPGRVSRGRPGAEKEDRGIHHSLDRNNRGFNGPSRDCGGFGRW